MLCQKPFIPFGQTTGYGCGKCLPCLVKRRRLWASRLILESLTSAAGYFITLTYNGKNYPQNGSLQPKDTQLFLKRLRKHFPPQTVRYFMVGEYGSDTQRAHYHAAIFLSIAEPLATFTAACESAWDLGFTSVGILTPQSAAYTAGYVTKKMTSLSDTRLNGRHPEFARMSLKPGIGQKAMESVSDVLQTGEVGLNHISSLGGQVPTYLKQGRSSLVLGRYLRRQLNGMLGLSKDLQKINPSTTPWLLKSLQAQAKILKEVTDSSSKVFGLPTQFALLTKDAQSVKNYEGRQKIKDGNKKL